MEKNKECKHEHHGGGFTNGFVFGFVLGGIVVFMLGTKKGKQIMKTLAENGFEGVSELTDLLEEDEEGSAYEEAYVDDPQVQQEEASPKSEAEKKFIIVHNSGSRPLKRFFRGTKKASS